RLSESALESFRCGYRWQRNPEPGAINRGVGREPDATQQTFNPSSNPSPRLPSLSLPLSLSLSPFFKTRSLFLFFILSCYFMQNVLLLPSSSLSLSLSLSQSLPLSVSP